MQIIYNWKTGLRVGDIEVVFGWKAAITTDGVTVVPNPPDNDRVGDFAISETCDVHVDGDQLMVDGEFKARLPLDVWPHATGMFGIRVALPF